EMVERLEKAVARNKESLDTLPPDPAGQLRDLQEYDFVDPDAKQKFEELLKSLRDQMMKPFMQGMQNAMSTMTPEDMARMREMPRSLLMKDERLEAQMRQLAMNLADVLPMDEMAQRYPFRGDEDVSLEQAMKLMDELSQLDQLERELKGVRDLADLDRIEGEKVEELLGEEAANDLNRLKEMAKALKDAGYLEGEDDDLKLTARAIRKIADKALGDIFKRLTRDRFGGHQINRRGAGGDQTDETKAYEFGDPFLLDLRETVMNA